MNLWLLSQTSFQFIITINYKSQVITLQVCLILFCKKIIAVKQISNQGNYKIIKSCSIFNLSNFLLIQSVNSIRISSCQNVSYNNSFNKQIEFDDYSNFIIAFNLSFKQDPQDNIIKLISSTQFNIYLSIENDQYLLRIENQLQNYNLGEINNTSSNIIIQVENKESLKKKKFILYQDSLFRGAIEIDHENQQSLWGKTQILIYGDQYIQEFLIFGNFSIDQLSTQINNDCSLKAKQIKINQSSSKQVCLFRSLNRNTPNAQQTKIDDNISSNQYKKRVLQTTNRIHGTSMRSIIRNLSDQEYRTTIDQVQTSNFLVMGYFKKTQTYGNYYISLMTLGLQSEFYNFLNIALSSDTTANLRFYQYDTNVQSNFQVGLLLQTGNWQGIGIAFSQSLQKAKIVYTDANSQIVTSGEIFATLPPSYQTLELCISCNIQGGNYDKFTGIVSSFKLIYGITDFSFSNWYFYNEFSSTTKSQILNTSFNQSSYVPGDEYDVGLTSTCASNYGFIEGACILNCQFSIDKDPHSSIENARFYDSGTKQCKYCMNDCTSCTSLTQCTACRNGYSNNNADQKCLKCESQSGCVSSCTSPAVFDTVNQICATSFDYSIHQLSPILLSSRIFVESKDFLITPTLNPIDYITHCYFDVTNNLITLHSFLGGTSFTQSTKITKSWNGIPKGYMKKVTLYALFYGNQLPTQLQVKINQRLADLNLSYKTLVNNQVSCGKSNTLAQSIYQVEYSIIDSYNQFDLEISSKVDSWAIRNVNIQIIKCHPTCKTCYVADNGISYCATCNSGMVQNQFQCNCQPGYFAKYDNTCYESPCITCVSCSTFQSNCKKCEDLTGKCTLCDDTFTVKDGICVSQASCTGNDEIFLNYCGVRKEPGISFFTNEVIVRFADYWKLQGGAQSYDCVGKKWVLPIRNNLSHYLHATLPSYYPYHYKVLFQMDFLFMDSLDEGDHIEIYDGGVLVYSINKSMEKRTDPTSSYSCGNNYTGTNAYVDNHYVESFSWIKTNADLQFQFLSVANTDDEDQSFASVIIVYERCHPICSSCTQSTSFNCSSCIENASKIDSASECLCNDGYYFTLVRQPQGLSYGRCQKCDKSCKTCEGPQFSDCKLCSDGYTKVGSICQYNCVDGQYWDSISSSCKNCHGCCRTCNSSSYTSCVDCNQDFTLDSKLQQCYYTQYKNYCEDCSLAVNGLCGGTQLSHSNCLANGWGVLSTNLCVICKNYVTNKCGGDYPIQVQDACQLAGYLNIDTTNCSSCQIPNSSGKLCGNSINTQKCDDLYWVKNSPTTCINCSNTSPDLSKCTCDPSCATCDRFHTDTACLSCSSPKVLFNKMCLEKCPNGFKVSGTVCVACGAEEMAACQTCYPTCQLCDPFTISVNSNTCISCSSSRKFDPITKECDCQDGGDTRKIMSECSYQDTAVLEPQLDNLDAKLNINFGRNLKIPSSQKCEDLFQAITLGLLGTNPTCSINNNYLVVVLSDDAMIIEGDKVYLKPGVLSFDSSPGILIQKFYNIFVTQKSIGQLPKVIYNYTSTPNSCDDISITFDSFVHTASRGFFFYTWSLVSPSPASDPQISILNDLITQLNANKKQDVLIPKGLVLPDVEVQIKLDYKLKINVVDNLVFKFTPKVEKRIQITITSTLVSPIQKYLKNIVQDSHLQVNQQGIISIKTSVVSCLSSQDIIETVPLNLDITSIEYPGLNFSSSNYLDREYIIEIKDYSLPISVVNINVFFTQNFLIQFFLNVFLYSQVVASLVSNSFIESKSSLILNVISSDLYIKIIGGNGFFSYKNQVQIFGKSRDYDLKTDEEAQGITVTWECLDPSTSLTCESKDKNPVTFPGNQDSATFLKNTFNPYTVVSLVMKGSKTSRNSEDKIVILFSELDLPPLGVYMQIIDPQQKTVNLNEEVYVELTYNSIVSVDLLSFSGTIIYEDNVVGIIKFDYFKLRFQIWNYYNSFKRDKSQFQIRFNIFNPQYYMPSMSLVTMNLNFPPNKCVFNVFPFSSNSYSIETLYLLQMYGCEDENTPISYQFFYYTSLDDYEQEKKYIKQVKRRQITDIQLSNQAKVSLPAGKLLLMAQAIDQKQAIYNSTYPIEVLIKQYSESEYLQIVQSKLNLVASSPPTTSIFELSILSDDILQRSQFKTSTTLNEKKIEIQNTLNSLSKILSPLSTFNTLADKAISVLISSGITYTSSQSVSLITETIAQLDTKSNLQSSNLELSKLKLNQKLYDNFLVLDQLCNTQISSSSITTDQSSQNKLIELHDKIGTYLFKNQLPNEDPIIFKGQSTKVISNQVTDKNICNYFMCDISGNSGRILLGVQPSIYNIKVLQTNENLYSNDLTYKNYTEYLKKQNPQISISKYPTITPSIKNQNNEALTGFSNSAALYYKANSDSISKTMACLTKSTNGWTKNGCKNVYKKDTQQYICICESLTPTTVIDDLTDLFSNSNLNVAFGSDGLSNLASFQNFYEYAAFWMLLGFTAGFVILYFKGKAIDLLSSKSITKSSEDLPILVSPAQKPNQTPNLAKNKVLPYNPQEQQNKNDKDQNQIQKQESLKMIDLGNQIDDQNKVIDYDLTSKQQLNKFSQKSIQQQQIESSPICLDQRVSSDVSNEQLFGTLNLQKPDEIKQKVPKENEEQNIVIQEKEQNNQSTLQEQNKELSQDDAHREQTLDNYFQNFKKQPKFKQILIFHNFFGIFYLYNPKIPRPLRFLVFYVRTIHTLAISVVFDQNYTVVQRVALSIVNALTIIVVIKLLEKAFTLKSKAGIILSRFLNLAILGTYYYIILSIISGISSGESNSFIGTFGIVFSVDIILISSISAFVQKQLAFFILKNRSATGFFYYAYKAIELQIVLLSLS